jgi:hypothetical protein
MLQLALLNRVPFGKFNRASAFPVVRRGRTAGSFKGKVYMYVMSTSVKL